MFIPTTIQNSTLFVIVFHSLDIYYFILFRSLILPFTKGLEKGEFPFSLNNYWGKKKKKNSE